MPSAPSWGLVQGWGARGTGEDRILAQLRAVTKKEAEASPGVGRRGVKRYAWSP